MPECVNIGGIDIEPVNISPVNINPVNINPVNIGDIVISHIGTVMAYRLTEATTHGNNNTWKKSEKSEEETE